MASNFDRWEKDPFFFAAEEVQESADRMESAYRRWIHGRKDSSDLSAYSDELHRELHTALGTAKWQLEEFERAVRSCLTEDARTRHRHFVVAIDNQIASIENSMRTLTLQDGKTVLPWVRLDQGESDELASFLTGHQPGGHVVAASKGEETKSMPTIGDPVSDCSKISSHSVDLDLSNTREEKVHGLHHGCRRTASASTEICNWNIAVADQDDQGRIVFPPPRILSFSSLSTMELMPKKWLKHGFRKWKGEDCHQAADTVPLQSYHISRGIKDCYEKSKSCLDSCGDESYNKELYGWLGAVQRQLQRSQYQIQHGRPIQLTVWVILAVFLIDRAGIHT